MDPNVHYRVHNSPPLLYPKPDQSLPRSFRFPQQNVQSVPPFSYLIPCRPTRTPTTLHLHFASFMATALSDTDPHSPVTFRVLNISPFVVAFVVPNDVHKQEALSNISQHVTLFTVSFFWSLTQPRNWRTTPRQLFATANSTQW